MRHKEQVVVVGGTKGLGKVVVQRFLDRGYPVTVLSRKPSEQQDSNKGLRHVSVDLERLTETHSIVQQVVAEGGPLRYLVFSQRYRGSEDPWVGELQVSLTATYLLIKAFADHFCSEDDKGVGVVSSVYADFVGGSQPASYHVAKAGLNQLIKYYAWVLGQKGIRINGIMPLTYLKAESRDYYLSTPDLMNLYRRFVPLKRLGSAEDSANLIDFLCSDKAAFINGQCIFIDGGVSVIWPEELAKSLTGIE
ncbi:MAG TPA: SDR family oxidoreductase [Gammaproteobacteria bacterium]|nr:SDR family oxidoreductase [Gammaproteobacteria bacterium]